MPLLRVRVSPEDIQAGWSNRWSDGALCPVGLALNRLLAFEGHLAVCGAVWICNQSIDIVEGYGSYTDMMYQDRRKPFELVYDIPLSFLNEQGLQNLMPRKVLFGVPTFHEGINTTVRNGTKWFEDLNVGEIFDVYDTKGRKLGEGQVVFQDIRNFKDIPQVWHDLNHDVAARTEDGLRSAMNVAYPSGWQEEDITVTGFTVKLCS